MEDFLFQVQVFGLQLFYLKNKRVVYLPKMTIVLLEFFYSFLEIKYIKYSPERIPKRRCLCFHDYDSLLLQIYIGKGLSCAS